jgi:hypothetical protein
MDDHYSALPFANLYPPKPPKQKGKRKRTEEQEEDVATGFRPPKRGRQTAPPKLSRKGKEREVEGLKSDSDFSSQNSSQTHDSHSYNLQIRKQAVYKDCEESPDTEHSEGDCHSDCTEQGPRRQKSITPTGEGGRFSHRLRPDELEVVCRTVIHTIVPSWIDRLPQNLGSASHGSLKAAEWLILYKVYYPIALIPLWKKELAESATVEGRERISTLLESTTLICKIAHFLTLPKINPKDLDELDDMILKYRQCLRKGWPEHPTKPNLHLTQHYSKVIKRFGTPRSTAAWAQEHVNGMLQRLPTNHQPRE